MKGGVLENGIVVRGGGRMHHSTMHAVGVGLEGLHAGLMLGLVTVVHGCRLNAARIQVSEFFLSYE